MKIKVGNIPYIYPIPIALAGANVNGNPNFETVGDIGLIGIKPPIVFLSSGNTHHTNQGILDNQTFSINFPNTNMLAIVDYCGQVSGKNVDKGELFDVFYGELETAPLIAECPVNLECKVIKEFSIQHRQVFIGEVIQTHVDEEFIFEQEGQKVIAQLSQLDPILYALDNLYYRIGDSIGVGYQEAENFQRGNKENS